MSLSTRVCLSLSAAILLTTAPVAAQQYTISQPNGGDTFGARSTGQTFTPSVGINPNPGSPAALPLVQITLHHGNYTPASPSTTTFLNIYDNDPNNGGNFLGSSTNSIDTNGLTFHAPMVWDFGQLPLTYTTEYWAVMSSTNTPGGLNVEVSLETEPRNGPPGPNIYPGGTGLIANIARHSASVDARFEVEFFVGVRGSFAVSGAGCPSSVGLATMSSPTVPTVGQSLQVDLANAAPAGLPFLILGFSDTNWGGPSLPVPLNTFFPNADPSCQILVSVDVPIQMTLNGTAANLTLPIPNDPNLAGARFFVQGWQFEAAMVSVTSKGSAVIGN